MGIIGVWVIEVLEGYNCCYLLKTAIIVLLSTEDRSTEDSNIVLLSTEDRSKSNSIVIY